MLEPIPKPQTARSRGQDQGTLKPHHEATFRVGHLSKIEPMLESMGIDPAPVFESAGFSPEQFRNPDQFLPFVKASQLFEHCIEATGREDFGFLLGQRVEISDFGLVGFMVRSAASVGRALRVLLEFLDLFDDAGYITLDIAENTTVVSYTLFEPGVRATDQIYDMSMTVMTNTLRALCGDSWKPTEVLLPRSKPENTSAYKRFFQAPVQFSSFQAAIAFSSQWLGHKPPSADEMLFDYLKSEAEELHQSQGSNPLTNLPIAISRGLMQDEFQASQVADKLGMHERTLQRLLAESGTSYREELNAIRSALAQQLLEVTSLTIGEVAISTGYGSSSAFIRAFKRWVNMSPGAWRKIHRRKPRSRQESVP